MRKIETRKAWGVEYIAAGATHRCLCGFAEMSNLEKLELVTTDAKAVRVRISRETDFKYLLSLAQQAEKALASAKSFAAELPRKKGRK